MRSSLRITNRPRGIGQRRSGRRRGRKEAYSRPNSNLDAYNFSDWEETDTDSEDEWKDEDNDEDSDWESDDGSDSDDDEDDGKCPACARVADAMRNWTGQEHRTRVGTFGRFQRERKWCDTCRQLVDHFIEKFQNKSTGGKSLRHFTPTFLAFGVDSWWFQVGERVSESLFLLRVARPGPKELPGIVPDKSWINFKYVRRLVADCDSQHAGVCHSFSDPWMKVNPPSRMLLIDVSDRRLVYVAKDAPYLALSYVWGKETDPLQTTLANFHDLRRKNAFNMRYYRNRLPNTIRDSMLLTGLLHQRYLWVDRFCIVQDDLQHKAEQLKAMASIYANAYLTIVAHDGDDDSYGLRGIGKGSEPRESTLREFKFAPDCHMVSRWEYPERKFVYPTRGWTFQEREVSRRQLTFRNSMVSWRCRLWTWDENTARPQPATAAQHGEHHEADLFSCWPNLPHYAKLVRDYNNCQVTYAEDALNAFSALTTIMARSMRGGTLFGLPEMFFDGCLLWRPNGIVARRRQKTVTPDGTVVDGAIIDGLPSWSWVGWAGAIDVRLWEDAHNFIAKQGQQWSREPYLTITRIIDWFKVNERSGARERIQNSYYETSRPPQPPVGKGATKRRKGASAVAASSWRKQQQRRPAPSSQQKKPAVSTATKTSDNILPPGWSFRHHVLLAREPFPPDPEMWSPVLEFKARRNFLTIGAALEQKRWSSDCVTAGLVRDGSPPDGDIVGAVVLNTSDPAEIPTGARCELIAISRGDADWAANSYTIRREFPEAELLHRGCPDNCDGGKECKGPNAYSFYNVLWIEWKKEDSGGAEANEGKTALRKALGRVYQSYWDSQKTEPINIRLG